jgi:hypothetical protein
MLILLTHGTRTPEGTIRITVISRPFVDSQRWTRILLLTITLSIDWGLHS